MNAHLDTFLVIFGSKELFNIETEVNNQLENDVNDMDSVNTMHLLDFIDNNTAYAVLYLENY